MWNIIGHRQTLAFFEHAQSSKHLSHAYLLTGPAQVGKRTLVLAFAQAILCTAEQASPPHSPCGVCSACLKAQNGAHPDLSVILPDEGKKIVSIDNVRALVRRPTAAPAPSLFLWHSPARRARPGSARQSSGEESAHRRSSAATLCAALAPPASSAAYSEIQPSAARHWEARKYDTGPPGVGAMLPARRRECFLCSRSSCPRRAG